jgi:hypothetical protein
MNAPATAVSLRYQIGPAEYLAKEKLLLGHTLRDAYRNVWTETLLFVAMCALGFVAAVQANSTLLMLVLGTALLAKLTVPWGYKQKFHAAAAALAQKKVRRRDVVLRVDAEGVHEEVEGVRSFAPWDAIKSYAKTDHVLMLELSGDFWALVPDVAFAAGAISEDQFIGMLRSRGVAERQ